MPKIKDLGIKVIPETMRPPEQGGGGCGCTFITNPCIGCPPNITVQQCPLRTIQPCGWPTLQCVCSFNSPCLCTHLGSIPCRFGSGGCGFDPGRGGSIGPTIQWQQQGGLTRDQIDALRGQLQQQITALDELAKSAGPQTAAEI